MISAIIYTSNTGYTKEYAALLSDKTGLPMYERGKAPELKSREVIYMGWLMAGNIAGRDKAWAEFRVKAVCAVGMSPPRPELPDKINDAPVFYLQGGFDLNRLKGPYKLIMKPILKKIGGDLEKLPVLTPEQQATLDMTKHGASCVCAENLAEVLTWYDANR